YRAALAILSFPADAEDAVSAAVEAAWKHLPGLRNPDALPAYLLRCTVNSARAALRRRKRETPVEDMEAGGPSREAETPVWMYVGQLKEKYRLPLTLRYGEGMREEEIARVLRVPRGTVSSRLSRGLRLLREQLEKEETGRDK
ncbi:MAG: sigma-70 family RNA polymerase sigma factor, partial [Eubacteriales bacterium]|nr:sigma-70 family RNA polymerase sigma factor [Eubacteriales bacterium]